MVVDNVTGRTTRMRPIVLKLVFGLVLSAIVLTLAIISAWWWLRSHAQGRVAEALAKPVVYEGLSVLESGSLALEFRQSEALLANFIHYYYIFPDGRLMRSFGDGQVLLLWDPDADEDEAAAEP